MEHKAQAVPMALPVSVTGPTDVGRLLREAEALDELFSQHELRHTGEAPKMPKTTVLMDQTCELNKLNLVHAAHRQALIKFLKDVRVVAPQLHISFSADPSPVFTEKLMSWLRREVHPLVLVNIGLQPNIGAGCVIRSTNKYFDLSLKQDFAKQRDLLLEMISGIAQTPQPEATAPEPVAAGAPGE